MPKVSQFNAITTSSSEDDYVPVITQLGSTPTVTYGERKMLRGDFLNPTLAITTSGSHVIPDSVSNVTVNASSLTAQNLILPLLPPGREITIQVGQRGLLQQVYLRAPSGKKIDKRGTASIGRDYVALTPGITSLSLGPIVLQSTDNQDYVYKTFPAGAVNTLIFTGTSYLPSGAGFQAWPTLSSGADPAFLWDSTGTYPGFACPTAYDHYRIEWDTNGVSPFTLASGVYLELGLGQESLGSIAWRYTLQRIVGDGVSPASFGGDRVIQFDGDPIFPIYRTNSPSAVDIGLSINFNVFKV